MLSIRIAQHYDSLVLALALLSIGNSKCGIKSRNAKNVNHGKKAYNAKKTNAKKA